MIESRRHKNKLICRTLNHGMVLASGVVLASGCATVKVEAPDKPIEINLNVKIEQEVRVRLDNEIEEVLADNPDIF